MGSRTSLLLLALLGLARPAAGDVTFRVQEPAGVPRSRDVVTVGVPLVEGRFPGVELDQPLPLHVPDAGATQTRVLQRWPDGSARWVLVRFLADLEARETRQFSLRLGGSPDAPAVGRESGDFVELDTGPLQVRLRRDAGFSLAALTAPTAAAETSGIVLRDASGRRFHGVADTVALRENGPVLAVVEAGGIFLDEAGEFLRPRAAPAEAALAVRFSLWITAVAGTGDLVLEFNLENPGGNDLGAHEGGAIRVDGRTYSQSDHLKQWLYFTDLRLELPLSLSGSVQFDAEGRRGAVPAEGTVSLLQWFDPKAAKSEVHRGFQSLLAADGAAPQRGGQSEGWLALESASGGATAAFQYFWQNWPRAVEYRDGKLVLAPFPELPEGMPSFVTYAGAKDLYRVRSWKGGNEANEPEDFTVANRSLHVFTGGRWKAARMLLSLGGGGGAARVQAFKKPLLGVVDGDYFFSTHAWPEFFPGSMNAGGKPLLAQALLGRRRWREALVHPTSGGKTVDQARWEASRSWAHHFGYPSFGDLSWAGGQGHYSNLHYDWPFGMLMDFVRYGDYAFFELGDQMARYRREWGQYHHRGGMVWADGIAWYEKSDHGWEPERPRRTHNWNGGLLLHYLLTGDELSRRALLENAEGAYASFFWGYRLGPELDREAVHTGTREQGWSILAMLHGYELTLDPRYLEQCKRIVRQITLPTLKDSKGMRAFVRKYGTLMFGYCGPGLIKLYLALPPEDPFRKVVMNLIADVVDGVENPDIKTEATYQAGRFTPVMYQDPWDKPAVAYTVLFVDVIAFLWKEYDQHPSLQKRIVENLYTAFVHQAKREATDPSNPSTWPKPGFQTATGGQITKELGWMGLFGGYAVATQYEPATVPDFEE